MIKNPLFHSLALYGLGIIAMTLNRFLGKDGREYFIGAMILLLYEIANPVIGIFVKNWWAYTGISSLFLIALFLLLPLTGQIISRMSLDDYGPAAMIYLVIIFYPFIIAICGIFKLIFKPV
jgi:hypothetical protein